MRILILGGDGMLGHQLFLHFREKHDVKVTLRQDIESYSAHNLFDPNNSFPGIDVRSLERLVEVMALYRPDVVINAVGIVKQRWDSKESIPSLEINALLPHRLSLLCQSMQARLIHLSTDCVFSGKKGGYLDGDISDAEDLYGKTKYLGEVGGAKCLTLRTSIIGRELSRHSSLFDWFTNQTGVVGGFTKAIYTGFTTLELSRIIEMILRDFPNASGVYQVSSNPISKYELLLLIQKSLKLKVKIIPDDSFSCDRSLDSSRFRAEFGYSPPDWNEMIEELCACP